jgi:hypothetical protein
LSWLEQFQIAESGRLVAMAFPAGVRAQIIRLRASLAAVGLFGIGRCG